MSAAAHVDGTGGFGEKKGGFSQRALASVEKIGNKVPNPAILFIGMCLGVIVLSQILDWLNVSVTSEVVTGTDPAVGGAVVGGEAGHHDRPHAEESSLRPGLVVDGTEADERHLRRHDDAEDRLHPLIPEVRHGDRCAP